MACGQPNGFTRTIEPFLLQEFNHFNAMQMYVRYNRDPSLGGGGPPETSGSVSDASAGDFDDVR